MLWTRLKGASVGKSLEFLNSYVIAQSQTTFTFNSVDFGNPQDNRTIIVIANGSSSTVRVLNSVTIGGTSSNIVGATTSSSGPANIISKNISSGSSGTVVLTYSGAVSRGCAIAVYACYGLTSDVAQDSEWQLLTSSTSNNRTVSTNAGDFIFSGLLLSNSQTITWSNVTQDATQTLTDNRNIYFASNNNAPAGTITVGASWASATGNSHVTAVFR